MIERSALPGEQQRRHADWLREKTATLAA